MKQSEIWLINLDPTIGAEMRKTRPALIVNDDALGRLPLRIIVPITDWKDHYSIAPWRDCRKSLYFQKVCCSTNLFFFS